MKGTHRCSDDDDVRAAALLCSGETVQERRCWSEAGLSVGTLGHHWHLLLNAVLHSCRNVHAKSMYMHLCKSLFNTFPLPSVNAWFTIHLCFVNV